MKLVGLPNNVQDANRHVLILTGAQEGMPSLVGIEAQGHVGPKEVELKSGCSRRRMEASTK